MAKLLKKQIPQIKVFKKYIYIKPKLLFKSLSNCQVKKTSFFYLNNVKLLVNLPVIKKNNFSNLNYFFYKTNFYILTNYKLKFYNLKKLSVLNLKFINKNINIKFLNLSKNSNLYSIKKKKIYSYKFLSNNFFFFFRDKQLTFYNKFKLDFMVFRKTTKKKNFNRINLISLFNITKVLKKKF